MLARLIAVEDHWKQDRVRLALCDPQPSKDKDPGLLHMAVEPQSTAMSNAKRFALVRLIAMLLQAVPQVGALPGPGHHSAGF